MTEFEDVDSIILVETDRSRLTVIKDWYDVEYSAFDDLDLEVDPKIKIFNNPGHLHLDRRFYSDFSSGYDFAGSTAVSFPFKGGNSSVQLVKSLMEMVNESLETKFNAALVNRYTSSIRALGQHADKTAGLSKNNNMVAALSYGSTRTFRITPFKKGIVHKDLYIDPKYDQRSGSKVVLADIPVEHGDLVVMEGDFQKEFKHGIPEQISDGPRISLTFREHSK